ncbi:uncharacterized protein METZ01_LOCUS369646 [marine metagenome]|uniref:Uncharacterized protein n=1 Tax=marine metagenome TaxID=408172 RepID=A0A382T4Q2_9ZZZZ
MNSIRTPLLVTFGNLPRPHRLYEEQKDR